MQPFRTTPSRPSLTYDGLTGTRLLLLGDSTPTTRTIVEGLPSLEWLLVAGELKPGVVPLLEASPVDTPQDRHPVVMLARVGAGKVLYHATDELWRWRFRTGNVYYGRYWVQALRYLSRGRLLGQEQRAELTSDRQVWPRGEPVSLQLRLLEAPAEPFTKATVQLEQAGQSPRRITLTAERDSQLVLTGYADDLSLGTWKAWVTQPSLPGRPPSVDLRVEAPQSERQPRDWAREDLQKSAESTGGEFRFVDEAADLPSQIRPADPVLLAATEPKPLWNRGEWLILLATLLGTELWLRQKWQLL